ncbi:MAG: tetratricopeptide repeat protein [Patescibacteria group bacterium]|jgi:tetratricopeptide (TPR) repeat protein
MTERQEPYREMINPDRLLFGQLDNPAEQIGNLDEAIKTGDTDTLIRLLSNFRLLEHLVITKGANGENLRLLESAVGQVQTTGAEVEPMALAELGAVYFHQKKDQALFTLAKDNLKDPSLPNLVKANLYNAAASASHRSGKVANARELNRRGLTLLENDPLARTPNYQWQTLKIRHGLLMQRADTELHPDMPTTLLQLAEQRSQLGDTSHVGRTYLDVGRLYHRLGNPEAALHYLEQAASLMEEVGYASGAVQALAAIGRVRQNFGETDRAHRVWVHGIGVGEPLGELMRSNIDDLKRELEMSMKIPATCLIELDGKFLLEKLKDGYMTITVDQESTKSAEGIVRGKISSILNHLYYQIDPKAAVAQPISLSKRTAGVHFREKDSIDTSKHYYYKVEISALPQLSHLDKTPKDGYVILTWVELQQVQSQCDSVTRRLIALEQHRRKPA